MEGTTAALDAPAIAAVDGSSQLADVLGLPEQLRDAAWKVESAGIAPFDAPGGLIVAGMGTAGLGGMLARAALGDRASRPIVVARGYELPPWTTPDTAVLCSSYTGDTEETLACYEAAGALGARRFVATSGGRLADLARTEGVPIIPIAGGYRPRAAVAYLVVAALEIAAACGAAPTIRSEIDVAAAHAEELVASWGPNAHEEANLAKQVARGLSRTIPCIAGSGLTAPVAYRWKAQINECAQVPALAHEFPELAHNEIQGWRGARHLGAFSAVLLDDRDLHPRLRARVADARAVIEPCATAVYLVESRGESAVERMFSLILLGDLVATYLAILGANAT